MHALSFAHFNMVHMTNWVLNGLPERFPKLKTIWIESGLAWIPFVMQRLDSEYMMRTSECPLLKRRPSEYMQEMYYTSQPLERSNMKLTQATFEAINADTQLLYASDWPHWDFDAPSSITKLPFLNEQAKRNILGLNAARAVRPRGAAGKVGQEGAAATGRGAGRMRPSRRREVGMSSTAVTGIGADVGADSARRWTRRSAPASRRRWRTKACSACSRRRSGSMPPRRRTAPQELAAVRRQAGERDRGGDRDLRDHARGRPQLLRSADVVPPQPERMTARGASTG